MYWKLPPDVRHEKAPVLLQVSTNDLARVWKLSWLQNVKLYLRVVIVTESGQILDIFFSHKNWGKLEAQFIIVLKRWGHLFLLILLFQVPLKRTKLVESSNLFSPKRKMVQDFWKALRQLCDASAIFQWTLDFLIWDQIGVFGGLSTWRVVIGNLHVSIRPFGKVKNPSLRGRKRSLIVAKYLQVLGWSSK